MKSNVIVEIEKLKNKINSATMKNYLLTFIILSFTANGLAQTLPPAPAQTKRILYTGGIAHTGTGSVIENSAIGFENGKLKLVADASLIKIDRFSYDTIINIQGKHVYPGLIALNSILGLSEIEAVRSTNDFAETGGMNPSVRAIVAYNTDSKVTPTVRSNGVLMAQIVPQGGVVSGQSSVVQLDAWNYEDAAYKTDDGIHLNWPSLRIYQSSKSDDADKQKERSDKSISDIRSLFTDAKAYAKELNIKEKNVHLAAMKGLFDGSKKLYIHCDFVKEIIAAVAFSKEMGVNMVLVGGTDSWMVTDLLKENKIPVILENIHRLPSRDDEAVDLPYRLPYLLSNAGVKFAISVSGFWQNQNLAFQSGNAAGYGLSKEQALTAVTASAAEILGVGNTVGSLEVGKDATFLITSGDLLDMKSSVVEVAFIQGRNINLDDTRKQSYRKYVEKYGLK